MGLRPAKCYRDISQRPYTRTSKTVHRRNYVGANPAMLIRQFNMGNPTAKYEKIADLLAEKTVIVRDNAIEATRIAINKVLVAELGKEEFFMKIRIYPFDVLRENKQAQGAGADRVSEGMSHSFGKAIGRAARIKKNQVLLSVLFFAKDEKVVKTALKRADAKLPCGITIKIHENLASIGTLPRKTRAMLEEAKEEEKEEEGKAEKEKKEEEKEEEGKAEKEKKEEEKEEKAEGKEEAGEKKEEKGKGKKK